MPLSVLVQSSVFNPLALPVSFLFQNITPSLSAYSWPTHSSFASQLHAVSHVSFLADSRFILRSSLSLSSYYSAFKVFRIFWRFLLKVRCYECLSASFLPSNVYFRFLSALILRPPSSPALRSPLLRRLRSSLLPLLVFVSYIFKQDLPCSLAILCLFVVILLSLYNFSSVSRCSSLYLTHLLLAAAQRLATAFPAWLSQVLRGDTLSLLSRRVSTLIPAEPPSSLRRLGGEGCLSAISLSGRVFWSILPPERGSYTSTLDDANRKLPQSKKIYKQLLVECKKLEALKISQIQQNILYMKQRYRLCRPKQLQLLSWKVKQRRSANQIQVIRNSSGTRVTQLTDILTVFWDYYSALYSSNPNLESMEDFFEYHIPHLWLTEDHRRILDDPITLDEILLVIQSLQNN